MANNTYIGGEIKLIGGLSDLFAIDSKIVRYTKGDNNGEISVQEIIDELLRRISVLEGSKNNVASITLDSPYSSLTYGGSINSFTITAKVEPDTALNKKITWTSDSTNNLTVNDEGLVNFISAVTKDNVANEVTVKITATSEQNPDISASCNITVKKANNAITIKKGNTNITGQILNVTLIDQIELTATDSSKSSTINWASDREDTLSIENGIVRFGNQYNTGDVIITASVLNSDNYKGASASTTLKVSKADDKIRFKLNNVEKTEISKTISTIETENLFKLNVTSDSINTINSFVSSNTNIATITKDSDGIYTVKMLKWDANPITLTATTIDDKDKRYSTKEETLKLTVNPITQTLDADSKSLSWGGSDALDAKEITISGNNTTPLSVTTSNNNIDASISGSKVSITPKSRPINGTVTITAPKSDIYKEDSVKITVSVAAQSTKYYWYAGWTTPTAENIATIINEVNGKSGQYIGTQLGTYTKTSPLAIVDYYDTNYSHFTDKFYIVIPDGIKVYDSEGEATLEDIFDSTDITIPGHRVIISKEPNNTISCYLLR